MKIPEIVKELPAAPDDVREWILKDVVVGRYMIYSTKEDRAVCSYCAKEYRPSMAELIPLPQHNERVVCPNCKSESTYKSKGIGRKKLTELTRVVVLVKKGKSVYASISEIDISFEEEKPEIFVWIQAVYKFNAKEQIYYLHHPGWCFGSECWEKMRKIKVYSYPNMGYFPPKRQGIYVYAKNFGKIFKNTDLKYADVDQVYKQHGLDGEDLIRYLDLCCKYPSVEILRKAGFWSLVGSKILNQPGSRAVNWRAKDLRKILNLNMAQIKSIREKDFDMRELEIYKALSKCGELITEKEVELVRYLYHDESIKLHTTIGKAAVYIAKQNEKLNSNKNRLGDYNDYLTECSKLGFDLSEKKTLFPKDFKKAHEHTSKLVREMKDKIDIEAFRKAQLKITGMEEPYISGGLLIRVAESQEELRAEGESLGHCVGGYANGVVAGTRAILFIRTFDKPDKSYYTLELNFERKIVQCRGKANCNMTDEVKVFVDNWYKEVIEKRKKKQRKVA